MINFSATDVINPISVQEVNDYYQKLVVNNHSESSIKDNSLLITLSSFTVVAKNYENISWKVTIICDAVEFEDYYIEDYVNNAIEGKKTDSGNDENIISRVDLVQYVTREILHVISCAATFLRFQQLHENIPSLFVTTAEGMFPFQAEGILDGFPFYLRYRSGGASLHLAQNREDIFDTPLYSAYINYGDENQSWLTDIEFCEVFTQLVSRLEKSEIRWEFTARNGLENAEYHAAWGHTAQEAWDRIHDLYSDDKEEQNKWLENLRVKDLDFNSPAPDNRVFPDKIDFTILDLHHNYS